MNLENVTAELRPRSEWEAADFGVRMIRRDAAAIYLVWFGITMPLLCLALLAIAYTPYAVLAVFLYWWLEPVADGPILRVISRRLFGEKADVGAAIRSAPVLAWQNKIFLISPYRFHLARSVAMPLTQLEGLKGTARRSRAKVLNLKILNHGIGVTTAYQHLALALYLGVVLIGFALVPTAYQETLGQDWLDYFWMDATKVSSALSLIVMYIAQSALQPWYVGAGFGLYINCRTQLEAWDIEVAFRRMAQRRMNGMATALMMALLVSPAILLPGIVLAQESPEGNPEASAAKDPGFSGHWSDDEVLPALRIVYANDALKMTRDIEEWQAIEQDTPKPEVDTRTSDRWVEAFRFLVRLLSYVVEFGFWIAAALLLFLIYATRKHWLPYLADWQHTKPTTQRIMLAGGEISAETLPDDIPAEILRLWNEGSKRKAVSLLYRCSVFAAVTRHGVKLPSSATEGECVRAVREQMDRRQSDYFNRVVSVWIRCAYGFQDPEDEALLPLCRDWPAHYGEAS